MLITREQQQALIDNYVKQKHNTDECIGFIDGIESICKLIDTLHVKSNKDKYCNAIEEVEYNHCAEGCGLEDLMISDRYEAMEYGWKNGINAAIEAVNCADEY
jgi:hypothetical protein